MLGLGENFDEFVPDGLYRDYQGSSRDTMPSNDAQG